MQPSEAHNACAFMSLTLYIGDAHRDLSYAPRPHLRGTSWLKLVALSTGWEIHGIGNLVLCCVAYADFQISLIRGLRTSSCYILIQFLIWDDMQNIFHEQELMPQSSSESTTGTFHCRDLILGGGYRLSFLSS